MVRVYLANITSLFIEETYENYYRQLPGWRQEKADRYRYATDRAQSVGVWSLWEKVRRLQKVPEMAVYNLSHSGNYVLCAYSDLDSVQVGCDLEEVKKFREPVARRFFCPGEYEHIMSREEPERTQLFYRYWVLKESFMKATRQGITLDMRSYEIRWSSGRNYEQKDSFLDPYSAGESDPILFKQPEEFPEHYYYKEYVKEGADIRIAVCATDPNIDSELHEIVL